MELSVIIPAYNECKNLETDGLDQAYAYLTHLGKTFEVLCVNDGSTDHTFDRLQKWAGSKPQVKIMNRPHQGKAKTVQAGMLAAKGRLRLFTDLDQSTPLSELDKLMPFCDKGYEVVIGSREVKGSKREAEPWYRHLMGKGFNLVVKTLTITGIQDTQCGFKLFSAQAAEQLFRHLQVTVTPRKDAFTGAFDVEVLFLAQKFGYKVAEVPVIWRHIQSERVSPVKDSVRMFMEVCRIRWADLNRSYDVKV